MLIALGASSAKLGIYLTKNLVITLFLSAGKCYSLYGKAWVFFFSY